MWLWCHQVRAALGMIAHRPDQQNLFSADTQYLDSVGTELIFNLAIRSYYNSVSTAKESGSNHRSFLNGLEVKPASAAATVGPVWAKSGVTTATASILLSFRISS